MVTLGSRFLGNGPRGRGPLGHGRALAAAATAAAARIIVAAAGVGQQDGFGHGYHLLSGERMKAEG